MTSSIWWCQNKDSIHLGQKGLLKYVNIKFLSCFLHRCEVIRYKVQRSHPKVDHFQFHPFVDISKIDGEDDTFRLANIDFWFLHEICFKIVQKPFIHQNAHVFSSASWTIVSNVNQIDQNLGNCFACQSDPVQTLLIANFDLIESVIVDNLMHGFVYGLDLSWTWSCQAVKIFLSPIELEPRIPKWLYLATDATFLNIQLNLISEILHKMLWCSEKPWKHWINEKLVMTSIYEFKKVL